MGTGADETRFVSLEGVYPPAKLSPEKLFRSFLKKGMTID
jgi:hypothetical protein